VRCDAVNTAEPQRSNHLADRYGTVTGPLHLRACDLEDVGRVTSMAIR
jgi:hypothetical protein